MVGGVYDVISSMLPLQRTDITSGCLFNIQDTRRNWVIVSHVNTEFRYLVV